MRFQKFLVWSKAAFSRTSLLGRGALVATVLFYASAETPSAFAGTTLTWNGADGASWTTGENWLDGETPSVWVDGANAVFPAAATVTLDGAVTVSNLTTSAALTVNGSDVGKGFLNASTPKLVFPGCTLDDLDGTPIYATLGGKYVSATPAMAFHYNRTGDTATAQFQMICNTHLRCVKVVFTETAEGVCAKAAENLSRYVTGSNCGTYMRGDDIDTLPNVETTGLSTSMDNGTCGVFDLHGPESRLNLSGEATFGGAVTLSNASINVISPVSHEWSAAIGGGNGAIEVYGARETSDITFGKTGSESGSSGAWLTTTATDTVFTNMILSQTAPVSAVMAGSSIGGTHNASVHHVKYDEKSQTMTMQFQFAATGSGGAYIKGVVVELKQDGANVTARGLNSYYHVGGTIGEDMTTSGAGKYSVSQNGVKNLTLRTYAVPYVKLTGSNAYGHMVVDRAHAEFGGVSTRPVSCLLARNGTYVQVGGSGSTNNGHAGRTWRFESGSAMTTKLDTLSTDMYKHYIFDGSVFYAPGYHSGWKDCNNRFLYMTLRNGARTYGNPYRYGQNGVAAHFRSEGTGTNYNNMGFCLHTESTGATLTFQIDADLVMSGKLYDSPNSISKSTYYDLFKKGAATLTFSGANECHGGLTVEAGTVALASDTALPASAPLTLSGGTLTCGATANSTGVLTLSGDAAIDLESGSLAFADSSGAAWTSGATLSITGSDKLPTRSLRFGTSESGLTKAQLRQITYNGGRVALDAGGYLCHRGGFMLIVR